MNGIETGPFMWPALEFATSVLGSQSKHKALAMLCSYFDESGITDRSPSVIVAGIVSRSHDWAAIEDEWRRKLGEYNLTHYHAFDCEHGRKQFEGISRPIRDSLTEYFARLIARVPCQAFASAVCRAGWKSHAPDNLKQIFDNDPFYLAFEMTLQQVSEWSVKYADKEEVGIVYARQQVYADRAIRAHVRYSAAAEKWPGIGSLSFGEPRLLHQLQAADLLAYEIHGHIKDRQAPLRPALKILEAHRDSFSLSLMEQDAASLSIALNGPRR